MTDAATVAIDSTIRAALAPRHRVVLVGLTPFAWLRTLQQRAPAPRMDLRYLVEGIVMVMTERVELRAAWIHASRQALLDQLVPPTDAAGAGGRCDSAWRTNQAGGASASMEPRGASSAEGLGTGDAPRVAEGAQARTQGSPASRTRHADCKALQIGETQWRWLKGMQDSTVDPRLEMRCLLEGAMALLEQRSDLLPLVVERAREALAAHLLHLRDQTIPPISMEIQQ